MRNTPIIAILLLALPTLALADNAKDRLGAGEIIVKTSEVGGSATPKLRAMAVIDAAPEKIWPIIDQCANYPTTMVRIAAAEELSRKGTKVRCRVTVDMPFPLSDLTAVTEATHTVKPGELWERKWKLEEGDYKINSGSWRLVPFNDEKTRTLVVYEVLADPKMSIPDGIKKAAQKKSIPELLEHLREQVK